MSHDMTKPTKWLCSQRRLRSAWASTHIWSESSLCAQWVAKDPSFLHADSEDWSLGGCLGWSESSLGAHTFCWFCHVAVQMDMKFKYSVSYRSYLVPEISGVKKPVLDKRNNTCESMYEDTQEKISQKIREIKQVRLLKEQNNGNIIVISMYIKWS